MVRRYAAPLLLALASLALSACADITGPTPQKARRPNADQACQITAGTSIC